MGDGLVFVHLSDIHFRCWSGSAFDLDDDLRHELVRDCEEVLGSLAAPDGILVTGDIAFRGNGHEYEVAKAWLSELCQRFGRDLPVSHDITQPLVWVME